MPILRLIIGAILRFVWDRAEQWYREEMRYRENKRVILREVKNVAREAAQRNETIAVNRESIDDSLLRLERHAQPRNIFAEYKRSREEGDRGGDSGELSEVPVSDEGSDPSNSDAERSGSESVGPGPDSSLPPAR